MPSKKVTPNTANRNLRPRSSSTCRIDVEAVENSSAESVRNRRLIKQLAFQHAEKEKRAAELIVAKREHRFQNEEKEKRAAEFIIANKELAFQNREKEKRAAELIIANKELAFQNDEKENRAAELIVANAELARDITERRIMEAELQETRDAALTSARLKSEFLANMSHEIRTPMNGVIGMTELLLETELSPQQVSFTKAIESSANSLLRIIDEILDFSKIEAGQMRFETIDFDLRDAVELPVEMFGARAQAKGVEISSLVHSDVPTRLSGDPGRLQQILTNLIGNAVKFTDHGDVFVRVTRTSETPTHTIVCFEIEDTGIGISEAAQQKLFHPFVQADGSTTRKYGGTGLGLAISKQLVELMGGEIRVQSTSGVGSVFSFTVRFKKQLTVAAPDGGGLASLRVLIVDDKEINRRTLLHQTTSWGMDVSEATSGVEALETLGRSPKAFDLVLLDLTLPDMDGFDLARAIKGRPELLHLRLVILSSFGKSGHEETVRKIGIDAFLQKPLRQSQIYNSLLGIVHSSARRAPGETVVPSSAPTPAVIRAAIVPAVPSGLRILVAEDNDINMEVARRQLIALGYTADFVRNGREAVDAVKSHKYDVVLMDGQMPEKDGFEATAEIRELAAPACNTMIVAVTAHALEGDREKCLAAGMDDYLSKPVKIDALRELLAAYAPVRPTQPEWPEELTADNINTAVDREVLASYGNLQQVGEPDLVVKLIDMFLDRSSGSITCLKRAALAGDQAEVVRQAHGLKGSSGNIGASVMAQLSAEIQVAVTPAETTALVATLEEAFAEAGGILLSIRDQRKNGGAQ
jgi:two-component system sensor histidine kinase/response regulator